MNAFKRAVPGAAGLALTLSLTLALGCTGGSETNAAVEKAPARAAEATAENANGEASIRAISPVLPMYPGAQYRNDLTRRDEVSIRGQYGANAEVYTMATDDSFPQVFHYYTTFLAQYRAFPSQDTYPPERRHWRTLEIQLDQAMQDPFIPGEGMTVGGKRVVLQIVETEAEPPTVIRYIVTPAPPPTTVTAAAAAAENIVVTR